MSGIKLKIFSSEDVDRLLSMEEAIEEVEKAFLDLSLGKVKVPERASLNIPEKEANLLLMPAYSPDREKISVKLISLFYLNPAEGLPLSHAVLVLFDGKTGIPIALMDASRLTALRTGAASGVATKYLARPDSRIAAIFGAGVQGKTQLEAICAVRPVEKAFVFDPDMKKAESFMEEMKAKLNIEVEVASEPEVLREVDIICTATTSKESVFKDSFLKPGVHINAVGSYKPEGREIPGETVARAKVVVDHRPSCLAEAGDIILAIKEGLFDEERIYAEIGEIIAGKKKGREKAEEITFFKSVGNAAQDLMTAIRVLEKGSLIKTGKEIAL